MLRIRITVLAVLVMIGLTTSAAFAGSAHFIKNATFATRSGDSLVIQFKEAGLESGSIETVQAEALATAVFQCVNGGNHVPSDPKKTTIQAKASASGTFPADKNGNITGSLTIDPPSAASVGFSCPPGQAATRTSVSYSNVSIKDLTSGASFDIKGTF